MIARSFRDELAASIDHTLLDQARKNELIIAYVRAITLVLVAAGGWMATVSPPASLPGGYPARIPFVASVWAVVAIGIAVALRRVAYRPSFRHVLPAIDGL